ncbi:MAG: carboxylesterase family protein [Hyphomonadaceae bacterium]|nr:carboxylesterase family protein [Hyphomonadaceae bacterium]
MRLQFIRAVGAALVLAGCQTAAPAPPTVAQFGDSVQVEAGSLRGVRTEDGVVAFKGVPFAAAPVGDLRWRAPQPVAAWDGVREAREFGPICMQAPWPGVGRLYSGPTEPSEDCLFLNVWTQAQRADAKLPVMVWIYGGAFAAGSGSAPVYDGANLARRGVVVVTFNYRLGPLGFLAHPELTAEAPYHASGNYGLLDQLAALRWVKSNIAAFGGDPANVTLFGQSAGAFSVQALQASPLAAGLFHRAIGESGAMMNAGARDMGRDFRSAEAEGVGYARSLGADSLAALRALPAARFFEQRAMFRPVERDGYLLPDTVQATFEAGRQNRMPTLTGVNAKEETTFTVNWPAPRGADARRFGQFYTSTADPAAANDTNLWRMWKWASLNSAGTGMKAYLYMFSHAPPAPENAARSGPVHGAEKAYVFDNLAAQYPGADAADERIADLMADYWTNFAKTGDPNGEGLPPWPVLAADDPRIMQFADDARAEPLSRKDALTFLDGYFAQLRGAGAGAGR